MSENLFASLQKIKEASKKYRQSTTFKIGEIPLTIETIDSSEEAFIQNWALSLAGDKGQRGFVSYYRLGLLALAIKKIGDEDLSGMAPDTPIETGEVLPNGTKIKVTRFKAIYDMLCSLDSDVVGSIFEAYIVLAQLSQQRMEEDVEDEKLGLPPKEVETISRTLRILSGDSEFDHSVRDPLDSLVQDASAENPES